MPLHVSRVHAICFDVDGTLSDTDDVMVAQLAELNRSAAGRRNAAAKAAAQAVSAAEEAGAELDAAQ